MAAPTKADLLAAADASDAEAEKKELEAALMRNQARGLRELAMGKALTTPRNPATLATAMEAQTRQQRVSRARLDRANKRHPFVAALVEKGLTVKDVAKDLGYPRSTVQSWYDSDKDNRRPIPRVAAVAIQAKYGVPLDAWPNLGD